MAMTLQELEAEAKNLTDKELLELAYRLMETAKAQSAGLGAEWQNTIQRRLGEIREGKVQCRSVKDVIADGRTILNDSV